MTSTIDQQSLVGSYSAAGNLNVQAGGSMSNIFSGTTNLWGSATSAGNYTINNIPTQLGGAGGTGYVQTWPTIWPQFTGTGQWTYDPYTNSWKFQQYQYSPTINTTGNFWLGVPVDEMDFHNGL